MDKRVCVFGTGGIGGYMAAHLLSAKTVDPGNELYITCIARGTTLEALREKGLVFQKTGGKETVYRPDFVTNKAADLPEQKLIVLCVKGYDLVGACEAIRPIVSPETEILPLLNGIDVYERIRAVIQTGIVLPACIYISSGIQVPGRVVQAGGQGNIIAGADPLHKKYNPALLASLMATAGIPFIWEADPFPALWTKYLFIASYALVTGLSGKSFGQILEDKELSASVLEILKELHALASAKGVSLPESLIQESYENARKFPYEATTSFARDLQVPGKPNEADLFGATILRLGGELGIPTPAAKAAHEAIIKKK
ncbi:MAG: ketopantoate reductase family protein [Spirochaetia bacterium]|nr:ketopantoate reductase family protein [Spirochaetia bacterium]